MTDQSPTTLLAIVRRKPGMTRQEFFNYHYQIHGGISRGPSLDVTPWIYYQTQIFDAVFPVPPAGGPPNANYPFSFADDMTELTFKNETHLKQVFGSDYVRNTVGPDGFNFSDLAASNAMMTSTGHTIYGDEKTTNAAVTADFFVLAADRPESGHEAAKKLGSILVDQVKELGSGEVYRIDVASRIPDHAGLLKYFGGGEDDKPRYTVVFKMFMKSVSTVPTVRKVQKAFEAAAASEVDGTASMVLFGKRAIVFDQSRNISLDISRQPVMFAD